MLEEILVLKRHATLKTISYYESKNIDNNVSIKETYLSGGYTMKEIEFHYGKHYTPVSRILKAQE